MRIALESLHRRPALRQYLDGCTCNIYSGEHRAYWGQEYCGYHYLENAGSYRFKDAWEHSKHCGPEKKIVYRIPDCEFEKVIQLMGKL